MSIVPTPPGILRPIAEYSIQDDLMKECQVQRFHPLQINGMIEKSGLMLSFHYGPDVYDRSTIENLANLYQENLLKLISSFTSTTTTV